jgi:rhamnosyl/mannosyltransferase
MMDLVQLGSRIRKPSVVTYHSDIVKQRGLLQVYRPLMHHFLRQADRIVATSPTYLQTSPVLAQFSGKTSAIPIGLDDAPPPDGERVEAWRARLGERFLLFVGALRYYKGLPFLLEAARETGLPVVLAGSGDDAMVAQAALPNVTSLGQVDEADKLALLSLCTAFVFPSHLRSEAFGVALLEAARAGKPMISCEIGTGTSYVNKDRETGIVVPPADAPALAAAMRTLWSDQALCERLGRAARDRYLGLFTAAAMGRAYKAIYDEVLGARQ